MTADSPESPQEGADVSRVPVVVEGTVAPSEKSSDQALVPDGEAPKPSITTLVQCGARTRTGTPCSYIAGYKTDHAGQGRCHLHGGLTPIKHGRYSTILRTRIRDLVEQYENDPEPLDIFPELAALRAMYHDFIERYDENSAAIIAWHKQRSLNPVDQEALFAAVNELEEIRRSGSVELTEAQGETITAARRAIADLGSDLERPKSLLDISDAHKILAEITKVVERIEKIRSEGAITRGQLQKFLFQLNRVIEATITDDSLRDRLVEGMLQVQV